MRFRSRRDFSLAMRCGKGVGSRFVKGFWLRRAMGEGRLGLITSRRVGSAVVRNRIKRIIREVFRRSDPYRCGVDWIVVVKPAAATATGKELAQEMKRLFIRFDRASNEKDTDITY